MKNVLLVTNNDYFEVLMQLLDSAQNKIDIISYSFSIGSTAGKMAKQNTPYQIAEKLVEIKQERKSKLNIRLYIEGARETADRNQVTAEFLKKGGVKVRFGATHAKGFCIDDRYVLLGSTNLTHQSITKNNETNLLFEEPKVAKGFETYFEHLWQGGGHGGVDLPSPLIADGGFKESLLDIIAKAKSKLEFSIYFFHHTEIEKAIIRAHERGVKVRGFIHHHNAFALSYVRRTRGTAERLMEGGIKDITFGPGHLFTHSKYIIRDREEILLGTGNWLHEDIKVHPQLYVRFKNKTLATELGKILGKQILHTSP